MIGYVGISVHYVLQKRQGAARNHTAPNSRLTRRLHQSLTKRANAALRESSRPTHPLSGIGE